MSEDDIDEIPKPCRDALETAKDAMLPPDDPGEIEPDYPPDYTPEDRVNHVLVGEFPRHRSLEWIAAAADTDVKQVESVVQERLAEGEVEISDEGVRRNRYHVFFEEVSELNEKVSDDRLYSLL